MSYAHHNQLGGQAFNHSQSSSSEQEYDRLRALARQEHDKMQSCFDRSHQAYASGNGAEAHTLSEAGKQHQATAKNYNKQASDYIFRENNSVEHVPSDTIDLHGQFVEEAEQILETRIRYAQQNGQDHLHVIVGKGIHSPNHVQKIKPKVEEICQELGLQYTTEPNAGRIYINLMGAQAIMPPESQWGQGHQQQINYGQQQQQPQYLQQQPQYQQEQQYQGQLQQQFQQEQPQQQQDPLIACLKGCCIVM